MSHISDGSHDHARVYNELKAMVIAYKFRPGEQLLMGELADRLRVSSTPVREALIRLQAEGLLDPVNRRGFFARELIVKEMIDLHECAAWLLKRALKRATERTTRQIFGPAALTSRPLPAMIADDEVEVVPEDRARQCAEYVERVYHGVARFSHNDVVVSMVQNIMERTHYVRFIDLEAPARFNHVLAGVRELSTSLQADDIDRAAEALERDFKLVIARMPRIIREGVSRAYVLHGPQTSMTSAVATRLRERA